MAYLPHPWDKYGGPGARETHAQTFWRWTATLAVVAGLVVLLWTAFGLDVPGQPWVSLVSLVLLVGGCLLIKGRSSGRAPGRDL